MKIYEIWQTEGVPHPEQPAGCIRPQTAPEFLSIIPHLLAIHVAIVEILEETPARTFLNSLLSLYMKRAGGNLANLRHWTRLEFMVKMEDVYNAWIPVMRWD